MGMVILKDTDLTYPIFRVIENMWIDDLTDERIQEVVRLLDSWRITDADGKLLERNRLTKSE